MNITERQKKIDIEAISIVNDIFENRNNDDYYHKGTFNTKDLPDHNLYEYFPNIDAHFRDVIYKKLNTIRVNHCLYWFELETNEKAAELNALINAYRKTKVENTYKKVPATNSNINSKILYLGVRQGGKNKEGLTNIEGRINQHLGYYSNKGTQGLQLYEYARGKDFEITIKVIEFEGAKTYFLNAIEKLLANEMRPLCGRH